jgi:tetratricopeptide (TPR) repeat protein
MERPKYYVIIILLIFSSTYTNAAYKSDIYEAYISNNMALWENIINEMNLQKGRNNDFVLELLNYQYGFIGWCLGNRKDDLAKQYLEQGEENLKILEKSSYKLSMVYAYQSAFYGYRIGMNKYKAPFIGPKSVNCAELAIKFDVNNPYGYIQYANAQYYMPAIFGGSKKVAIEYFKKAEKIMEVNQIQLKEDWNYLSLLTMIAKACIELKNYEEAKAYYEKILKTEPNFLWVKNELYPELLKKLN